MSNTDSRGNVVFDFVAGRKKAAKMTNDSLEYTKKDIVETIRIQEKMKREGFCVPKLGYYWDELSTIEEEIRKRQKDGKFNTKK